MHNAWITTAGEKMSKSLGNSTLVSEVVKRVRPVELRYYLVASHYRSHVEFSFAALEEAGAAFRRIEGFVERATELTGGVDVGTAQLCADFTAAMDDDLAVPQALAALQATIREGNKLLADGPSDGLRGVLASVRGMLAVLGLDPLAPQWRSASSGGDLRAVVDALVAVALDQRQAARARKDWAAADGVRDALAAAGVVVEDTPAGPRWTIRGEA
jgi:cysteinyl-tRNA synthetase